MSLKLYSTSNYLKTSSFDNLANPMPTQFLLNAQQFSFILCFENNKFEIIFTIKYYSFNVKIINYNIFPSNLLKRKIFIV